jgi:hypothetical protein
MTTLESDIVIEKINRPVYIARVNVYREYMSCNPNDSCAPCHDGNPACLCGSEFTISKTFLTKRSAERWAAKKYAFSEQVKNGEVEMGLKGEKNNAAKAKFLHAVNAVSRKFFGRDIYSKSLTCTNCGWRGFWCEAPHESLYKCDYHGGEVPYCPECESNLNNNT